VRGLPNVSVETAGFDPTAGMVELAVRELGAERVIYGSDAPGRSFASQLAKVESAALTPVERNAIFAGNLRRLLQPILQRKGIKE
jgi:predicted TIM-barrel fold metal-dependent hydrolase